MELQAGESILFPATTKEVKVTVEGMLSSWKLMYKDSFCL